MRISEGIISARLTGPAASLGEISVVLYEIWCESIKQNSDVPECNWLQGSAGSWAFLEINPKIQCLQKVRQNSQWLHLIASR